MELDFDNFSWTSMFADTYNMKPKQDPRVVFKNVFNFKEYYEELKEVDVVKFLRFIPMAYDKNSPLRSHFTETVRLKIKAADLAGFVRQDDGRFLSNVENVLNGGNEIANRMIIRYVVQHKNSLYTRFVMYQELYENEMNKLRSGEKGAAKISEFDTLGDKLDEIRQELFSQDNNIKLQNDFHQFYFEDKLLLRPEDIAEKLRKGEPAVAVPQKKKIQNVSKKILQKYLKEDEFVTINIDDDLHPIHIKLPVCEDITQAQGYGLEINDQKFTRIEMPKKLTHLLNTIDKIEEVWATIGANQVEYTKEIKWIEEQWYYCLHGFWFYNRGRLTFLDGWHYNYLNFWKFSGGVIPEYRDRDRKWFHAVRYAYTTTEYPSLDKDGRVEYIDKETRLLKMQDAHRKVFLGYSDPKGRRAGDSNKHLCAQYFETITNFGKNSGIISSSGGHAKDKLFDEILVAGWQQMPFFLRPITSSNENPEKELKFNAGRKKADSSKVQDQLKSKIDHSPTAAANYYDGGKLFWLLADEGGKTKDVDVYERHQQLKQCVAQGAGINIIGFMGLPSTVGEMEGSGGRAYYNICKDSKFEERNLSGQTITGLMLIFISCLEGLEGFVDEYGYSVVDTPTPEQAKFIGKNYGALDFVKSTRESLLKDAKDIEKYNEFVRLFPIKFKECFRTSDGDIGFNTKIINERLDELAIIGNELTRVGNFRWEKEKYNSLVVWEDNPKGKWTLSQILPPNVSCKFTWVNIDGVPQRQPHNPKHVTCCDPYKQEKVNTGRMSDGGIATAYDFDPSVDSKSDNPETWKSYRLVCTYRNRPGTTDDFYDDVLLEIVYFNSWLYPEINIPDIIRFMQEKGFAGYFLYDFDWKTGRLRNTPGFSSQGAEKQNLFNTTRNYIQIHGHKERHADFLKECKDIQSMEEMTDYDLFTAGAGALKGCMSVMSQRQQNNNVVVKRPNLLKKRTYAN
jgi:hypothetical protein